MAERWKASILIIEDDPDHVVLYSKALRQYCLRAVATGSEALAVIREEIPDLIILDHILAGGEKGTDFLPRLKTELMHVPILVIAGTLGIREQLRSLPEPCAAEYVIEKPVDIDELLATVESALSHCGVGTSSHPRPVQRSDTEPEGGVSGRKERQTEILRRFSKSEAATNINHLSREFKVSRLMISLDLQDLVKRGQLDDALYREWDQGQ